MADTEAHCVVFHPLGFRADGRHWIVGRSDTGPYVTVPQEGMAAIRLLKDGMSPPEVQQRMLNESGKSIDVEQFVRSMAALGFIRSMDGHGIDSPPAARPTLPRVRPGHVRWMLSPVLHGVLVTVALTGLIMMAARPELRPHWGDLLWSDHGSPALLGDAALTWLLILFHELAHLFTARAADVPGVIRMGTRLQFLVVQTDVSGVWLRERPTRIAVYLSGMMLDLTVFGGCILLEAATGSSRLLSVVAVTELGAVAAEFMVFMRTDLYFLLQDLLGCRNLYRDALQYCQHVLTRCLGRATSSPLSGLDRVERRSVRTYAVLMAIGSAACVLLVFLGWTNVTLVLLAHSADEFLTAPNWLSVADALATTLMLIGVQALWANAWWRRHGTAVRNSWRPSGRPRRRGKHDGIPLPTGHPTHNPEGPEGSWQPRVSEGS
ncbi:hypothetical protein [Streptomyces sp. RKAG293]|uniref:hypothetical protein n=1 Tax=Streptomyces sp. RKAG293 TaxID=2893403 RepID=UPI002033B33F|nr:hypothetical protein [Streptomyces sp. RKAG293]MCM2420612.1 hypothetical protein [Streptomyces sp. RKAG293]